MIIISGLDLDCHHHHHLHHSLQIFAHSHWGYSVSEIMTQTCYAIQAVACPTTPTYLTCPTSSLIVVYSKTHMFMQFNDTKDLRKVDWAKKGRSSGQIVDLGKKLTHFSDQILYFVERKLMMIICSSFHTIRRYGWLLKNMTRRPSNNVRHDTASHCIAPSIHLNALLCDVLLHFPTVHWFASIPCQWRERRGGAA